MHRQAAPPSVTLTSLYSSGQCLLSVLGSIGVILLFAGIPQLIYAPQLSPGSLMTFLLGAVLISLMVAGNAFISYKYRQMVRDRQEADRARASSSSSSADDKPPSYDDLLEEEGLPPPYANIDNEKPPRYEELVTEVFNWRAITKAPDSYHFPCSDTPRGVPPETPILVPLHRHLSTKSQQESQTLLAESGVSCLENLAFQDSSENLKSSNSSATLGDVHPSLRGAPKKMPSSASMPNFQKLPFVHRARKISAIESRKHTIVHICAPWDEDIASTASSPSTSSPTSSTSSSTSPTSPSYSFTSSPFTSSSSSSSSSSSPLHTPPSNLSSSTEPESSNL